MKIQDLMKVMGKTQKDIEDLLKKQDMIELNLTERERPLYWSN